jgi:murein DD-endopeptidase MepM/ murein hydrolase activator NlpD
MDMAKPQSVPRARRALNAAGAIVSIVVTIAMSPTAQAVELRLSRLTSARAGSDGALHGGGTLVLLRHGPFALCPVDPTRHFVDDFGDARYAGGYHPHQGIDILAPKGTPIRAPFNGRAKASTSWAGGLQVYVYGRHGFVFNAHLSRAGHLGRVSAGTIVGYVGNSGDARWSSTHDHFEWHPRGGHAVDSYRLLQAVCGSTR